MSDKEASCAETPGCRSSGRWIALALALVVAYPLSSAPVLRLWGEFAADSTASRWDAPSWWNTFYHPVLSLSDSPQLRASSDAWFDRFGVGEKHRRLRRLRRINADAEGKAERVLNPESESHKPLPIVWLLNFRIGRVGSSNSAEPIPANFEI